MISENSFPTKPFLVDVHSHLNFPDYDADRIDVLRDLASENIWTISVGTTLKTSEESVLLAEKSDIVFATIGLHPADGDLNFDEKRFQDLFDSSKKIVAIGECGLDYARIDGSQSIKQIQKSVFERQIEFAVRNGVPVMIHVRDAFDDLFDICLSKKKEHGEALRFHFHFFAGDNDVLKKVLSIDATFSFTGVITFASVYTDLVRESPLSHIMVETDAPYVTPIPFRGKRNNPLYVKYVVEKIAEIKGISFEEVQKSTVENTLRVFLNKIALK